MAKDSFDFIEFKILAYYYAWRKGKLEFRVKDLEELAMQGGIDECYFLAALRSLVNKGFIEGLAFSHSWGDVYMLANDYWDGSITSDGARYLEENSTMKKAKKMAVKAGGFISRLMPLLSL